MAFPGPVNTTNFFVVKPIKEHDFVRNQKGSKHLREEPIGKNLQLCFFFWGGWGMSKNADIADALEGCVGVGVEAKILTC